MFLRLSGRGWATARIFWTWGVGGVPSRYLRCARSVHWSHRHAERSYYLRAAVQAHEFGLRARLQAASFPESKITAVSSSRTHKVRGDALLHRLR